MIEFNKTGLAHHQATKIAQPKKRSLNFPTTLVTAQLTSALQGCSLAISAMRTDQINAPSPQTLAKGVGVRRLVINETLMRRSGFCLGRPRPRRGADTRARVRSIKVTSAGDADSRRFPKATPWPSATTLHSVPLPFLAAPTQCPLFWPGQSCRRQRLRPNPVALGGRGVRARRAMPSARPADLPRRADGANRCWEG